MSRETLKAPNKFWIMIASAIIAGVVAFTKLQSQVSAMESREKSNREQFYEVVKKVDEIYETVIKIEKDIEYIKART